MFQEVFASQNSVGTYVPLLTSAWRPGRRVPWLSGDPGTSLCSGFCCTFPKTHQKQTTFRKTHSVIFTRGQIPASLVSLTWQKTPTFLFLKPRSPHSRSCHAERASYPRAGQWPCLNWHRAWRKPFMCGPFWWVTVKFRTWTESRI